MSRWLIAGKGKREKRRQDKLQQQIEMENENKRREFDTQKRLESDTNWIIESIENGTLVKGDEKFNRIIYNAIHSQPYFAKDLLKKKIITREDGELFNASVDRVLKESVAKPYNYAVDWLINFNIVTEQDGDLYNRTLEVITNPRYEEQRLKEDRLSNERWNNYTRRHNEFIKDIKQKEEMLKNPKHRKL